MRGDKRAQMNMSFGMIFSIILIVVFIAFAFYGIMKFLDYQKKIQVGQFVTYLQDDINKIYSSSQGSIPRSYVLPSKIEYVCIGDFSKPGKGNNSVFWRDFELFSSGGENNLFFYPREAGQGYSGLKIDHIDSVKITEVDNPYCIKTVNSKVKMNIKIDLGDTLVTLTR